MSTAEITALGRGDDGVVVSLLENGQSTTIAGPLNDWRLIPPNELSLTVGRQRVQGRIGLALVQRLQAGVATAAPAITPAFLDFRPHADERATAGGRVEPAQRGTTDTGTGPAAVPAATAPGPIEQAANLLRDTQLRLEADVTVSVPSRLPLGSAFGRKIKMKPALQGMLEVAFGARNPRVEAIIARGGVTFEENHSLIGELSLALERRLRTTEADIFAGLQTAMLLELTTGADEPNIQRLLLRTFGRITRPIIKYRRIEIAPNPIPELSLDLIPPKLSAYVLDIEITLDQGNLLAFEWLGVPVRVTLVGKLLLRIGISLLGWKELARFLITHLESAAANLSAEATYANSAVRATRLQRLATSAQRVAGFLRSLLRSVEIVNTILGITLVTIGLTFLAVYGFSAVVGAAHERGRRHSFANIFVRAYVYTVFGRDLPGIAFAGRFQPTTRRGIAIARDDVGAYGRHRLQSYLVQHFNNHRQQPHLLTIQNQIVERLMHGGDLPSPGSTLI